MKKIYSFIILICLALSASAYQTVSFYVVAHPDDWQLFMANYTAKDISDQQNKTVLIYITAGDASFNSKTVNKNNYMSRERGAVNAVQFTADINSKHLNGGFEKIFLNNHAIRRFVCKNTVSYFLRLPDGCDGKGFNGQSLILLRQGKINRIDAVDSSTQYTSWGDLAKTVKTIMLNETGTVSEGTLNISDTSVTENPGDHHDHVSAARLALHATNGFHFLTNRFYTGYHMLSLAENLTMPEVITKTGIFAVTDFGRTQANQTTSWTNDHLAYLSRCYVRIDNSPRMKKPGVEFDIDENAGAFPNPAQNVVFLNYMNPKSGPVSYELWEITGQALLRTTEDRKEGKNTLHLDLSNYSPGSYIIKVYNGGTELASSKFLKL